MSWQAYVDTSLIGTGKVSKAAIIGHDGNTWATSTGFTVSPAEGAAITGGYADPNSIRGSGIHLNGEKYFTLRADERSIYGKQGNNGVSIVKTTQAILIAVYESPIQPGESANEVEKLADYLISVGY